MNELFTQQKQLDELGGIPFDDVVVDIDGIPHDERIHTKNKSKHEQRETSFCAGWLVTDCSDVNNFDWSNINYDYYIAEARKLIDALRR